MTRRSAASGFKHRPDINYFPNVQNFVSHRRDVCMKELSVDTRFSTRRMSALVLLFDNGLYIISSVAARFAKLVSLMLKTCISNPLPAYYACSTLI
jgi:hypothetical protein